MNYAIYFGLAFLGSFMSFMLGVIILCLIGDVFLFEGEEWKNK